MTVDVWTHVASERQMLAEFPGGLRNRDDTAEALLLAVRGRPIGRDELPGPGATLLHTQLT